MELTIDRKPCDTGDGKIVIPAYDCAAMADVAENREGRSLSLTIPRTGRNDVIFQFANDPYTARRFNEGPHTARIGINGAILFAGTVRLLEAGDEGYRIEIREGGARWARNAARQMFNKLAVNYHQMLLPTVIMESWTNDKPVKFFPIHRDDYSQQNSSSDSLTAERLLSVDDYHPFLHIATLLEAIFSEAGYRISSSFIGSVFFRSLYMSGAYSSRNIDAIRNRMDFAARRLKPVTATADLEGCVTANPKAPANSVGNIVETATPQAIDADGEVIPGLCNNGGCFVVENGKIGFKPPVEVSVGFEYYFKYTTDHRILTRKRLKGFDSIYLGVNSDMSFTLANRYVDRRPSISNNFSYRAIVFNHIAGAQYRLTFTRDNAAGTLWTEFSGRSALVSTPASGSVSEPRLHVFTNGTWIPYTDDWALYDGYITETGKTTVELRVHTASETVTPGSPKRFDIIYFYGADAGMSLTLDKTCSVRPHFTSSPGYGSSLDFADVAQHRVRQIELLESVQHLFNLRFYTEEATKTVFIEPADDFHPGQQIADWRSKTDFSQPVILADIAPEVHESRTWGYLDGDGAVSRFNTGKAYPLGEWTQSIDSYAAKEGNEQLRSPLFCPTLNSQGHYSNAPSALIMQVGDRDAETDDGTNFTPRIVRYCGMHPLPAGERWGYPSNLPSYPLAAFHFTGDASEEGFTLCFEDRDGLPGLHRYYDNQIELESSRQRITLSLRIAPEEYEALFAPGIGMPDIRSVFVIDTGAGAVKATLHTIGEYDPATGIIRCTFTRFTTD